jgi:hypothetical protein
VASTTSSFGLTDLHFFDECFGRPEFFLDRSLECSRRRNCSTRVSGFSGVPEYGGEFFDGPDILLTSAAIAEVNLSGW